MTNQQVSHFPKFVPKQNLLHFIVQIRHATSDKIVGTGFVVSTDGKIVTCKHVVRKAGIAEEALAEGVEVGVYFPQVKDQDMKSRRARVLGCFSEYDDDVVLLQLVGDTLFLSPQQIAVLGTAVQSHGNDFLSYGYKPLGEFSSGWVYGKILGHTELKRSSKKKLQVQVDYVQLSTDQIRRGVSGAPVLDKQRNLVVGIIAKRFYPGEDPGKYLQEGNADNVGWAVDAQVLSFNPMNLPLQDVDVFESSAPQPPSQLEKPEGKPVFQPGIKLNNAPPPLPKWVGRVELLHNLDEDWRDSQRLITGLIGFGGEGKSSLTRRWLDNLLDNRSLPQPKGVFWWGFYERRSVDEFFEALLTFLVQGIDPNTRWPSAQAKAQVINATLKSGRYLFVLDGLEVLQHQDGDDYGLLKNADLRDWLQQFAAEGHESFCTISSRAPLLDLIDFTTYTHRDVECLSVNEGCNLLRKLGVVGTDEQLEKVVQEWDGYALVLSLLGSYLVDRFEGKIEYLKYIPAPTAAEPKYDRVRRVLRRYDEHLTVKEQEFLEVFSAFRLPVPESALEPVFGHNSPQESSESKSLWERIHGWFRDKPKTIAPLPTSFELIVERLVDYRILRHNTQARHYTTHPLIRAHYLERLQNNLTVAQQVYRRIADYYLGSAGKIPEHPTLQALVPLIEAVHHLCKAGDYDRGCRIFYDRIDRGERWILAHELGAFDTGLSLLQEFFPENDPSKHPLVSSVSDQCLILRDIGFFLMCLGRLKESESFYQRALPPNHESRKKDSGITLMNLTEVYAHLGKLDDSATRACEAFKLSISLSTRAVEAKAWQAYIAHLQGNRQQAESFFKEAEDLEKKDQADKLYLYAQRGIHYADYLNLTGNVDYARKVTEVNLKICQDRRWINHISWCHRVLGDLDADAGKSDLARQHYDEAVKKARKILRPDVLIPVLSARGRWLAKQGEVTVASRDLDEALNYAVAGGYRIYEADIRVGLAWAHLKAGNPSAAQTEAEKAQRMSEEMGYHWGQVDAQEVLAALE